MYCLYICGVYSRITRLLICPEAMSLGNITDTSSTYLSSVFEDNACPPGAIVNSYHNSVRFTGDSTFARNVGAALRVF